MAGARELRENSHALLTAVKEKKAQEKAHKKQIHQGFKSIKKGTTGLLGIKSKKKAPDFVETSDNLIDIDSTGKNRSYGSLEDTPSTGNSLFSLFSCCTNCCEDKDSLEEERALLLGV